jgi:glutamate--cysteine ligase catalytic subunit
LVVTYSKDDPKILLSLRQADILEALANDKALSGKGGCAPALPDGSSYQ